MVDDQNTPMAAATANAATKDEALPKPELPTAQDPASGTMTAFIDIQIPTWNLGERIPIAPQVWDADTPQVGVGAAEDEVDIINLDDSETTPAAAEPLKQRRRRSARKNESDRRNRRPMAS
jgi:hypothetical protein